MEVKETIIHKKDLKKLRKKAGITQKELASRTGIGYYYLNRCENGKFRLSMSDWKKIKKVLDGEKWWIINK